MPALTALLAPGVVGTYTHFEVTEVFATLDQERQPRNVFTILVAESRDGQRPEPLRFLNPERIKLKSLPGWTFGVARYTCLIIDLVPALAAMVQSGELAASGKSLRVGKLRELPEQFVPPDFSAPVPWNKVLKNNFWNGSYVFEWSDGDKNALQPLFDDSRRLQELSASVGQLVPMTLAALSDRLGNVAVQVPVIAVMSQFNKLRTTGAFTVDIAWDPRVPPRSLRASCELEFDGTVSGYAAAPVQAPQTTLPVQPGIGMFRGVIWDDINQAMLAVSGPGSFINAIGLSIHALSSEPRTFSIKDTDGSVRSFKVGVSSPNTSVVGDTRTDDNGGHTRKRIYQDQLERLAAERVFVQYKPQSGHRAAGHERALDDLRKLIRQHGREGAWLWDPYLTAHDVLETLFHCPHAKSDLRALTGALAPPAEAAPRGLLNCIKRCLAKWARPSARKQDFVDDQRGILDAVESNWLGLRLEYRVRRGPVGFGFHDRFLIFPLAEEGALAWSLGTSVNGMGMEHHILQRVDNGQLVRDAFVELWEQLDQPEHLVWKKP
jgi:hypothetical protein